MLKKAKNALMNNTANLTRLEFLLFLQDNFVSVCNKWPFIFQSDKGADVNHIQISFRSWKSGCAEGQLYRILNCMGSQRH